MKKKAVTALILVTAMVLSACGSSGSSSADSGSSTASEEEAPAEASSSDAAASESTSIETEVAQATADESGSYYTELVKGSEINLGVSQSVTSWGPWSGGLSPSSGSMAGMIYQTLMTMELEPTIAYEYEVVDDTTYDFKIWDNITDSAGNPIKASDVVFSYEQGIASGNAHGIDVIESITAPDDTTVEFKFNRELLIGDLNSVVGQIAIVSQKSYEESDDQMINDPIGSGPYVLDKWVADSVTVLKARDDYWATPEQVLSPGMEQTIETVNYTVISEASQLTIGLENGTIDYATDLTTEDLALFQDGGEYADSYNVDILISGLTNYLLCNCSDDMPTANEDLREAIYYAVDAQSLITGARNGMGIITHDGSNPTLEDYDPDWNDEDNFYNYNLDTAKQKLADAGYKEGDLSLTLFCESGDVYVNTATLIQAMLLQIGIDVKIEPYENTMLADYVADSSSWDLLLCVFGSEDYVTNNWAHVMDPANYSYGKSYNFVDDDHVTELLNLCKSVDGHTKENLDEFHEYVTDNAYMRGLFNGYSCAVINSKYTSYYNSQNNLIVQATTINE